MPTESLRRAVLCAKETVPRLRADLDLCHRSKAISEAALSAKIAARDKQAAQVGTRPTWLTLAIAVTSTVVLTAGVTFVAVEL